MRVYPKVFRLSQ